MNGGRIFRRKQKEGWRHWGSIHREGAAGSAYGGHLHLHRAGGRVVGAEYVKLRRADVVDIGREAVDFGRDLVEGRGQVAVYKVGAAPAPRGSGQACSIDSDPGGWRDAGEETCPVDDGVNDRSTG